ncbi:helix-turn-helix transcriptional regulator [Micromonospora halophytica]|uniref:Predicted transcriptional regulator, ArsR family n=1 Tax=Micromonospora halophytica TaxID=47864 RepID=A0A1C5IHH7_9ACTN|nr:helix-turn-helix domain-containing protein [Micromonospora halophytica]SCG57724.1 Predicted transcriptional regulator, ArsR family [Micromonospora halophytica]
METRSAPPPEPQPSGSGRAAVLDALRAFDGPVTIQALAGQLRLHPSTVRFHLMKLVQGGLVHEEQAAPEGPGRPRLCYRAVRDTPPAGPTAEDQIGEYQLLSHILTGYVAAHTDDPAAAARSAGRQWGHFLVDRPAPSDQPTREEVVTRVSGMLDKLGFEPETEANGEILLHRCPFRAVAERHPGVICSVHLGLLQGATEELGGDPEQTVLEPFVTPRLCVARLPLTGDEPEGGRHRPDEQHPDDSGN